MADRLFVALDLPAGLALPSSFDAPWRPVPAEKRHVTLVFLGTVEAVPTLPEEAPPLGALRKAGWLLLPPRRPRVLAVGLEDVTGEWTAYQGRMAAALGVEEDRPWLPHVTVARTRERVRRAAPSMDPPMGSFVPGSVTLYRSEAGRYTPIARVGGGAGP